MSALASGLAVTQMLFLRLKLEVTDRDVDQQSAGMLKVLVRLDWIGNKGEWGEIIKV